MDINDIIKVIDKKDNKPYPCKIIAANVNEQKIKVHFIDWSDSYDEWIHKDSERIVDNDSETELTTNKPDDSRETKCKEIIGRLLMKCNDTQRKVISAFNHSEAMEKNEKHMGKLQVPMLEDTAEYLNIRIEDANSRKLYTKPFLVKKIIKKLYSLLPSVCPYCSETYSIDLKDKPLFLCHVCEQGAHNCKTLEDFNSSLPKPIPKGFVWICPVCRGDSTTSEESCSEQPDCTAAMKAKPQDCSSDQHKSLNCKQNGIEIAQYQLPTKNGTPIGTKPSIICAKYRKGVCPHGLRGNKVIEGKKCSFEHPRACRKYSSFGSKGPNGCKRESCRYYHPVLCRYSFKDRLCVNQNCTFVHLKGTKRHREDSLQPVTSRNPPVLTGGNNTIIHPKNEPLEKIEAMIRALKESQELEIRNLKQELSYIKSASMQPRWGMIPQWQQSQLQCVPIQSYSQAAQTHPIQAQGGVQIPYTNLTRQGQPMGGIPPEGITVPRSCC